MLAQVLRVQELAGHDGLLLVLVAVERSDALLRRAVLLVLQALLLERIQLPVPRQQERGAVADLQVLRRDGDARGADGVHLALEVLQIDGDAVAEDVHNTAAEDAGRQQMEGELAQLVYDRVARVAAALIAHDHVKALRQIVDHAALALVAPVDTYNCTICHICLPPVFPARAACRRCILVNEFSLLSPDPRRLRTGRPRRRNRGRGRCPWDGTFPRARA